MDLQELKFNKTIISALKRKQWTVEKLATASATELVRLPGIGQVTAREVIKKAKEIVNQRGLEESQHLDGHVVETETIDMAEAFLSVRQRRILAAHEQRQKEEAE